MLRAKKKSPALVSGRSGPSQNREIVPPAIASDHSMACSDGHYGRVEAMDWADEHDNIDYIFGLAGNAALDALV
jgi:hypothetical protein